MKCNKCNGEWTPPTGISLSKCPFCNEPLTALTPKESTEPHLVLRGFVESFGESVLQERRLSGLIADVMTDKTKQLFRFAADKQLGVKILSTKELDQSDRSLSLIRIKESFIEDNFLQEEMGSYVVDCFLYALGWMDEVKKESRKESNTITTPIKTFINIPDPNFKAYLLEHFDLDKDDEISIEEAQFIKVIECSNRNISSLEGIQHFTNLIYLNFYKNELSTLDVSKNPSLIELNCSGNRLTNLDVSKNPFLNKLNCSLNALTILDVSKNPSLIELDCSNNRLTTLDVSKNPSLIKLYCYGSRLTNLDVSKNPSLIELYCWYNALTTLDVSKNPSLIKLYCSKNRLTTLDVSKNPSLAKLICGNGKPITVYACKNASFVCSDDKVIVRKRSTLFHLPFIK